MKDDVKLFNDDSLKLVEEFIVQNCKVNHIITDPPYNISKDNNFRTLNTPRIGVNFGEWDRGKFDLFSWISEYVKLLDKNGSMIIFCSYRYISHIIDEIEKEHNEMVVKDIIIWQKSNPMPRNVNRRYVQDMEFAIWAVKKKSKWVFNKSEDISYLRSIFTTTTVSGKERTSHPTQKSLKLMRELISIHTNENDVIIDPFMGSGTTGVAARELNRKFIGIEIDKEFYNLAKKRLGE